MGAQHGSPSASLQAKALAYGLLSALQLCALAGHAAMLLLAALRPEHPPWEPSPMWPLPSPLPPPESACAASAATHAQAPAAQHSHQPSALTLACLTAWLLSAAAATSLTLLRQRTALASALLHADWFLCLEATLPPVTLVLTAVVLPSFDAYCLCVPALYCLLVSLGVVVLELPPVHSLAHALALLPCMLFLDFSKACHLGSAPPPQPLPQCGTAAFLGHYVLARGVPLALAGLAATAAASVKLLWRRRMETAREDEAGARGPPAGQAGKMEASEGADQSALPVFAASALPLESLGVHALAALGLRPLLQDYERLLTWLSDRVDASLLVKGVCLPVCAYYFLYVSLSRFGVPGADLSSITHDQWLLVFVLIFVLGRDSGKLDMAQLTHDAQTHLRASRALLRDLLPEHVMRRMLSGLGGSMQEDAGMESQAARDSQREPECAPTQRPSGPGLLVMHRAEEEEEEEQEEQGEGEEEQEEQGEGEEEGWDSGGSAACAAAAAADVLRRGGGAAAAANTASTAAEHDDFSGGFCSLSSTLDDECLALFLEGLPRGGGSSAAPPPRVPAAAAPAAAEAPAAAAAAAAAELLPPPRRLQATSCEGRRQQGHRTCLLAAMPGLAPGAAAAAAAKSPPSPSDSGRCLPSIVTTSTQSARGCSPASPQRCDDWSGAAWAPNLARFRSFDHPRPPHTPPSSFTSASGAAALPAAVHSLASRHLGKLCSLVQRMSAGGSGGGSSGAANSGSAHGTPFSPFARAAAVTPPRAGSGTGGAARRRHSFRCHDVATSHPCVTIFFSDIVGFSTWAHHLPPSKVMSTLNELYSRLDDVILHEMPSLYKVETIGDAYVMAANLLTPDPDHATTVVRFALRAQQEAAKVLRPDVDDGSTLQMRIGIHSGPVMSGVVGKVRRRFCLFGDTMNMASRTETSCPPGCIQLTATTHNLAAPALAMYWTSSCSGRSERSDSSSGSSSRGSSGCSGGGSGDCSGRGSSGTGCRVRVVLEERGEVMVKGSDEPLKMYLARWGSVDASV